MIELCEFPGHPDVFQSAALQGLLEKGHEAVQVIQRDHRGPVAHQGIVCIVPFWSLGVEPDAGFRNEIGHLGQDRCQNLLQEVYMVNLFAVGPQQRAVGAQDPALPADAGVPLVIKPNGVLGICQNLVVRLDEVRNGGVNKPLFVEK